MTPPQPRPELLLVVGIVGVMLASQFSARPVRPLAYVWAALLIAHGCVPPGPARATTAGIAFLIAGLAVSVVFGFLRGGAIPVWRDAAGRPHRKGDRVTLLLWLATLASRLLVGGLGTAAFGEPFGLGGLWLGVGVTFGVQHAVTSYRARRLPPAPPGPNGRPPHRPEPGRDEAGVRTPPEPGQHAAGAPAPPGPGRREVSPPAAGGTPRP
ncbi:hypothetical protein ACFVZH_35590 [Streptomyces sp. NPDC059534]|uniref:hypothetical protein n=1 Tax=Streptomyces sp. NPDC059534 TaxID=3346859 RepID=UPI00368DD38C